MSEPIIDGGWGGSILLAVRSQGATDTRQGGRLSGDHDKPLNEVRMKLICVE